MGIRREEVQLTIGVNSKQVAGQLNSMTQTVMTWGKTLVAGFGASWGMSKLLGQWEKLDERIDSIKRTSEKSGLSKSFVQDLMNLGKLSGIGEGQIEGILEKFAKGLEAGEDPAEKIRKLADALANTSDAGERARMAIDAFGKSGTKMIPILSQGADAVDRLSASMGKLTDAEIKDIDELNDRIDIAKSKVEVWFARFVQTNILNAKAIKSIWRQVVEDGPFEFLFGGGAKRAAERMAAGDISEMELEAGDNPQFTAVQEKGDRERAAKIAADRDAAIKTYNEMYAASLKKGPSDWVAFSPDPRKESQAKYYENIGKNLKGGTGKVFLDRASALRDAEMRTLADGTIQKRMIGEDFFDAIEKSKKTPQSVIIKGVEGE